jgi:Ricin-type beta-trefoil lectin domain
LDVFDFGGDGAGVIGHTCNDEDNQKWIYGEDKRLRPLHNLDMCLDYEISLDDMSSSRLMLKTCGSSPEQTWVENTKAKFAMEDFEKYLPIYRFDDGAESWCFPDDKRDFVSWLTFESRFLRCCFVQPIYISLTPCLCLNLLLLVFTGRYMSSL